MNHDDFKLDGENYEDTLARLKEEDFATYVNLQVSTIIKEKIRELFHKVQDTMPKSPKGKGEKRHILPEKKATNATEKRKEMGHVGESDRFDDMKPDLRKKLLEEQLSELGYDEEEIEEITGELIDIGLKYIFRKLATRGFIFSFFTKYHDRYWYWFIFGFSNF